MLHPPLTWTITRRFREPSNSQKNTACHVPSVSRPPWMRICSLAPTSELLQCASELPSLCRYPRRDCAEALVSMIPNGATIVAYNAGFEKMVLRDLAAEFPRYGLTQLANVRIVAELCDPVGRLGVLLEDIAHLAAHQA